jgi:hypothetical protein
VDFSALGIDAGKRAENLAVADYAAITQYLSRRSGPCTLLGTAISHAGRKG